MKAKPTLTLTIGKEATQKQIEKAVKTVYLLASDFKIAVVMEDEQMLKIHNSGFGKINDGGVKR